MRTINERPTHEKLLLGSYWLAAFSSLLAALATISAAANQGKLKFPQTPIDQPHPPPASELEPMI